MKLFDANCHVQMPQFDEDRDAVLAHMQEKGMGALVVGTDYQVSNAGPELARQHDFLWASVGLHPNDNEDEDFDMEKYQELAQDSKVVAIGECGLDYFRLARGRSTAEGTGKTGDERMKQMRRFEAHMQLALHAANPLIIHSRDAHADMPTTLAAHRRDHGAKLHIVIHFFTGTRELAQKYLDLGCHLSFPGPITYTDMYDASIDATPLEKMLVETDSPFAAPVPFRGKRNEPAYVEEVAKKIAKLKGVSIEELNSQIIHTAQRLFGLH